MGVHLRSLWWWGVGFAGGVTGWCFVRNPLHGSVIAVHLGLWIDVYQSSSVKNRGCVSP